MSQPDLSDLLKASEAAQRINEMCRSCGAAFVIDTARAWVIAKERAAAEEHRRWREQMLAAEKAAGERDHG